MMRDRTVLLGVTGSIAAYKAVDLASKLTQAGAKVDVVMTECATEFVTPLSFSSITHRPTVTYMFDTPDEFEIEHIALAERANVVVIAPATANIIAKLAAGIADDMLTCSVLATRAPIIVAPAMNVNMWENSITQENVAKLRARGFKIVEPGSGSLACGAQGKGRLADIEDILTAINQALRVKTDLAGRRVVVSAGGTQEPIDPVRYVGNRSSGKMGFAMAEAARDRGAEVTLITGPDSSRRTCRRGGGPGADSAPDARRGQEGHFESRCPHHGRRSGGLPSGYSRQEQDQEGIPGRVESAACFQPGHHQRSEG